MHATPFSPQPAPQRGLTLVEAMVTLAIAAILFTWAVPSLKDFITRNRMSTEVNNFVASLYLARSEAVKRLRNVGVCPSTDGNSCLTKTEWKSGWMVYADVNGGGFNKDDDTVIQRYPALPTGFQINTDRSTIVFQPDGQSPGTNETYVFCDSGGVANTRKVTLSSEGRVRTERLGDTGCTAAAA